MSFDAENFGVGLLVGWASAYGIYRARHVIREAWESVGRGATTAQNSATRSADSRYINDLVERCETTHIAGKFFKLSDIIIEPRFLPTPEFAAPPENEVVRSVYRVVPNLPDHPYLQAPFNIETMSIDELAVGSKALALLGVPGSGRTTALLAIALHSLGVVRFTPPMDKVQEQLNAEEARLEEKERAVRIKERVTMEQRAKERLATELGGTFDAMTDEELKQKVPLFNRLMPVYVHFADLNVTSQEFGAEADPVEYIVRAVQHSVKRVTSSTIPRKLYSRFNRGQILLLLDGFDELPEEERPAALAWLKAYLSQYSENFLIVTGPAKGYGPLLQTGLTPAFIRPWSDLDIKSAAERWADAWSRAGKRRRKAAPPEPNVIERAYTNARGLSPLEVSLKIWASYAQDTQMLGMTGWMQAFLKRYVSNAPDLLSQMAQLAVFQLDEGYITFGHAQALSGELEITADAKLEPEDDSAWMYQKEDSAKAKVPKKEKPKTDAKAENRLLETLRRGGLLVRYRGERYRFRHHLVASYLASLALKDASLDVLSDRGVKSAWKEAIAYAALSRRLDSLVAERMKAAPDLLRDNVIEMARWLAYAPAEVEWRGTVLNTLGNLMIAPSQYPLVRDRVAAALIDTRDKNVLLIFRKAVRNIDADIRRLACLGMGALGDSEALRDLPNLLADQNVDVQLAAGMALGTIGTDDALQPMIVALTSGSEQVRQTMAEAFAAMPAEGYPTLYEAVTDEDFMLRRAAVFGLRRLRTTWALVAIYRAFLEDDQWYVRSAAQQAFQEMTYGRGSLTSPYPKPEEIPWLQAWATKRGETMVTGEAASQMLLRALKDGEAPIRTLAATNLGQLGMVDTIRALYAALRDGREEVRATAYQALGDLQVQMGEPLPSPM